MSITNFNLRGVPSSVMMALKRQAEKQDISVNLLILQLIEKSVGYAAKSKKTTYHDLDKLAGTWSKKDANEFTASTKDFEKIDKDLWE
jgi:hypothetical protein